MPNRVNSSIDNNSINTNISNHLQKNNKKKSNKKIVTNPFILMNQPKSPMDLEMEKFKKMKMQERKNSEQKMKLKRDNNSTNKRGKIINKTKTNLNKETFDINKYNKYKDYLNTEVSEKYDNEKYNIEKKNIPKLNNQATIEVDNKLFHINYNNSYKYTNLFTENDNNVFPQDFITINNLNENNNICSISASINS
jgi:hypothetical protein